MGLKSFKEVYNETKVKVAMLYGKTEQRMDQSVIEKRVPEKANIIEKRGRGSNAKSECTGRIHCCGQQDRKRKLRELEGRMEKA